jgi:hypothetical protein
VPRKPRVLPVPEDKDTQRAIDVLNERIQELESQLFYDGKDFEITTPDATDGHIIAHGLGRKFRGFLVTDASRSPAGAQVIWRDSTFTGDPAKFIKLLPLFSIGTFKVRIF